MLAKVHIRRVCVVDKVCQPSANSVRAAERDETQLGTQKQQNCAPIQTMMPGYSSSDDMVVPFHV